MTMDEITREFLTAQLDDIESVVSDIRQRLASEGQMDFSEEEPFREIRKVRASVDRFKRHVFGRMLTPSLLGDVRLANALRNQNFGIVAEIVVRKREDFASIRNIGVGSLKKLDMFMRKYNLDYGMSYDEVYTNGVIIDIPETIYIPSDQFSFTDGAVVFTDCSTLSWKKERSSRTDLAFRLIDDGKH